MPIGTTIDLRERNAQPPAASAAAFDGVMKFHAKAWRPPEGRYTDTVRTAHEHTVKRDLGAFKGRPRAPHLLSEDAQEQRLRSDSKATNVLILGLTSTFNK